MMKIAVAGMDYVGLSNAVLFAPYNETNQGERGLRLFSND